MIDIPRHTGRDADGKAQSEADHFMVCPGCGVRFDMRDLGQVLAHVHDQPVELDQGDGPPPNPGPRRKRAKACKIIR